MPTLNSPLASGNTGVPLVRSDQIGQLAGAHLHFPSIAAFQAAVASEQANVAASSPLWADGQRMTIADENNSRATRVWSVSLNHARTVQFSASRIVLNADTNVVLAAAGIPANTTGNDGDVSVDLVAGVYYLRTSGVWGNPINLIGLTPSQRWQLPIISLQGAFRVWSGNAGAGTTGTIQVQWQAPAAFNGVRLIFGNETSSAVQLSGFRVSSPTTKGSNGASATAWTEGSIGGVTPTAGSPYTLAAQLLSAPNELQFLTVSDLIQISPSNNLNLLYTRADYPGAMGSTDPGNGDMLTWNNNNPYGFQFQAGLSTGIVGNNTGITMSPGTVSSTTVCRDIAPLGVMFNYTVPVTYIAAVGGSHLRGDTTYGDHTGFIYRACMIKNATSGGLRVWSPFNSARSGGGSAPALATLKQMIAQGLIPDILVILASSGDDGTATVVSMATAQMRLVEMVEYCKNLRIRPIICTAPPINNYPTGPGSPDDLRKTQNIWARNLCANFGLDLLDLEAMYVDPLDPLQHTMNPVFSPPPSIHANDQVPGLGQNQSAAVLASMLY